MFYNLIPLFYLVLCCTKLFNFFFTQQKHLAYHNLIHRYELQISEFSDLYSVRREGEGSIRLRLVG